LGHITDAASRCKPGTGGVPMYQVAQIRPGRETEAQRRAREAAAIGVVAGTVTDASGAGIAGASVTVAPPGATAMVLIHTATTDVAGAFSVEVPAGMFQVVAKAAGYLDTVLSDVTVAAGEAATVNVVLQPVGAPGDRVKEEEEEEEEEEPWYKSPWVWIGGVVLVGAVGYGIYVARKGGA